MKNKIPKIIFITTFLPYLFILLYGIFNAFAGISFFYSMSYGFEAFIITILFMLYTLTLKIPIIPICLIFQICYIFRKKINKFKNIGSKKYVRICCLVGVLLILSLVVSSHSFEIRRIIEKASAKQMVNKAEEKIGFNKNDIMVNGIFNMSEYKYSHILIDYDNIEIGMLLNSDYDQFWKVELKKTTKDSSSYKHIINDYYMQADIPLKSPGKRLISFYEQKNLMHRTIAFLLIYEDGTIYCVDNIKEKDKEYSGFTGLQWSDFFVGENIKFNK